MIELKCSKELVLWYFLNINFRFQPEVRNYCHDLIQNAINFNDAVIVTDNGNGCRIFLYLSKDEAIILLKDH